MRTDVSFSGPHSTSTSATMSKHLSIPIDQNWTFRQADNESSDFLPVSQFPTNVHLDLLAHKLIPDPFIGKNELDVQWVGEAVWLYRTHFATPTPSTTSTGGGSRSVLAFDGLDTFATVRLNGKQILKTDNMFTPERVDVTDLLRGAGEENELEMEFESAYLKGWAGVEEHPEHAWGCWNGDNSRLAVRKAQYHWVSDVFSYGWCNLWLCYLWPCCLAAVPCVVLSTCGFANCGCRCLAVLFYRRAPCGRPFGDLRHVVFLLEAILHVGVLQVVAL